MKVTAGYAHSLALLADGSVLAWGLNSDGQIGDGTYLDRSVPSTVPGLGPATDIAAGAQHSLVLLADGTVLTWATTGADSSATAARRGAPFRCRLSA